MVMNGLVLSAVIIAVYISSLHFYCEGRIFQADIDGLEDRRGACFSQCGAGAVARRPKRNRKLSRGCLSREERVRVQFWLAVPGEGSAEG